MSSINKFGESLKSHSKVESKDGITNAYFNNRTDLLTNKIDGVEKNVCTN